MGEGWGGGQFAVPYHGRPHSATSFYLSASRYRPPALIRAALRVDKMISYPDPGSDNP
jgi:hypothetical protein